MPGGFLNGVLMHSSLLIAAVFVSLPPFRALAKKAVFKPGDGPDKEKAKSESSNSALLLSLMSRRRIRGRSTADWTVLGVCTIVSSIPTLAS